MPRGLMSVVGAVEDDVIDVVAFEFDRGIVADHRATGVGVLLQLLQRGVFEIGSAADNRRWPLATQIRQRLRLQSRVARAAAAGVNRRVVAFFVERALQAMQLERGGSEVERVRKQTDQSTPAPAR